MIMTVCVYMQLPSTVHAHEIRGIRTGLPLLPVSYSFRFRLVSSHSTIPAHPLPSDTVMVLSILMMKPIEYLLYIY